MSLTGYIVIFIGVLSVCVTGALLAPRHRRACPQCEVPIAVTAGRCRHCGYEMT
jgi:predicted amidophosphoribosyltransferase